MAPHVLCECCQRTVSVEIAIPQIGDIVPCPCGAELRLTNVTFEPVLEAALYRPPVDFDDEELTPVEVPSLKLKDPGS